MNAIAGLQWWELVTGNGTPIQTYADFQGETLSYFEPVNRELTARKSLSNIKQMGKLTQVTEYNREFSKWLLQIPSMTMAIQIFHYSQFGCNGIFCSGFESLKDSKPEHK